MCAQCLETAGPNFALIGPDLAELGPHLPERIQRWPMFPPPRYGEPKSGEGKRSTRSTYMGGPRRATQTLARRGRRTARHDFMHRATNSSRAGADCTPRHASSTVSAVLGASAVAHAMRHHCGPHQDTTIPPGPSRCLAACPHPLSTAKIWPTSRSRPFAQSPLSLAAPHTCFNVDPSVTLLCLPRARNRRTTTAR